MTESTNGWFGLLIVRMTWDWLVWSKGLISFILKIFVLLNLMKCSENRLVHLGMMCSGQYGDAVLSTIAS